MANLTITANNTARVAAGDNVYRNETFTAGAAKTHLAGTILARKRVSDTVTAAADAENTGNGTCTALSINGGTFVPKAGAWNLECVEAIANGGRFKLEDPDDDVITNNLIMDAGAGAATAFVVAGLKFTLTDGSTDFSVGDKFAITVTAVNKMVVYASAGTGGAQFPTAVLSYPLVTTASGDVAIEALIAGKVRKDKLVIDADGDGTNVTAATLDHLRDYGIIPIDVTDLSDRDNYA